MTAVRDSTANLMSTLRIARTEHETFDRNMQRMVNQARLRNRILNRVDWIFACSEFSKMTHIEQGIPEEKIMVAGVGVDTKRFHPPKTPPEGNFRAIFVGSATPLKGLKYLFESWENFAKGDQELLVCGDRSRNLSDIFTSYRKRINMKETGFVDPSGYYRQASVLVYPSLTEGSEKVTLEAMASGLPVITTTNTNAAGIIREGREGFVVPIQDSKSIAKYLNYFYDNPGEIKRMGRNARRLAEKHSWERFSKRMCKIFETAHESG
jgi:glycosyltransferase involved in cell wall biosynthesis